MRPLTSSIWIALITACGPMYPAQPGPPPPAPVEPVREVGGTPDDPYAGALDAAEPAAATRPAAHGDAAAWVEAHNRVRAKHCAGELAWSAKLAQAAQRWANALRDRGCSFGHSGGSYGENLAAGTTATLDPATVVKMWYDEIAEYRFPDGGFSSKTGHFTQVVWRGTTQVGCGRSQCKGMDIFVCEYSPAGNWEGQYRDNVKPRGCR
ncbi:MAG TPA: CAP domain-containing protein [Kofleriaceae bacterium]|nr:CAP domain-containing protein [Kofleriaceae bacterium]HMG52808.1 CAP domain-containing protein [Kofleriaceae bacterium]